MGPSTQQNVQFTCYSYFIRTRKSAASADLLTTVRQMISAQTRVASSWLRDCFECWPISRVKATGIIPLWRFIRHSAVTDGFFGQLCRSHAPICHLMSLLQKTVLFRNMKKYLFFRPLRWIYEIFTYMAPAGTDRSIGPLCFTAYKCLPLILILDQDHRARPAFCSLGGVRYCSTLHYLHILMTVMFGSTKNTVQMLQRALENNTLQGTLVKFNPQ